MKIDPRNWTIKCPDRPKGVACEVCGGKWICLESWRKKRTVDQRKKAYYTTEKEKKHAKA